MTLHDMALKAATAGFAALAIGAGSVLLSVRSDNAVQDQRIAVLERSIAKIDDMDKTLRIVDNKVDVLNQKLDDAKDALSQRK